MGLLVASSSYLLSLSFTLNLSMLRCIIGILSIYNERTLHKLKTLSEMIPLLRKEPNFSCMQMNFSCGSRSVYTLILICESHNINVSNSETPVTDCNLQPENSWWCLAQILNLISATFKKNCWNPEDNGMNHYGNVTVKSATLSGTSGLCWGNWTAKFLYQSWVFLGRLPPLLKH